jgi:hypothetical protein
LFEGGFEGLIFLKFNGKNYVVTQKIHKKSKPVCGGFYLFAE